MSQCRNCGSVMGPGTQKCTVCGAPIIENLPTQRAGPGYQQQQQYHQPQQQQYHQPQHQQYPSQAHQGYAQPDQRRAPGPPAAPPPPPFVSNAVQLNQGEQYIRCWRCQYMANPDAPQINGVLLTTNIRLIFLEETRGQAQPYKMKFSVNLVEIRGISTEGLFNKRITVNGQSGPNPWMMIFDDVYDIDQATFQVSNKVDLNWMQAHLLELKSKAYR